VTYHPQHQRFRRPSVVLLALLLTAFAILYVWAFNHGRA
jgi:hypothetical protein